MIILSETTMIHPLDCESRLDEDQYWRQRQGHGKLNLMITYSDVWKMTVPWGAAAVAVRMIKE